jgi:hypothetical protein
MIVSRRIRACSKRSSERRVCLSICGARSKVDSILMFSRSALGRFSRVVACQRQNPLMTERRDAKCKLAHCHSALFNQGTELSAQKRSRLQQPSFCDPTTQTMLSTIFQLPSAKLYVRHLRQQASSSQSQLGHGAESLWTED